MMDLRNLYTKIKQVSPPAVAPFSRSTVPQQWQKYVLSRFSTALLREILPLLHHPMAQALSLLMLMMVSHFLLAKVIHT